MAPSPRSPVDPRKSNHRARLPSLTEFPDSPSVYSPAYQSPDPDAASFSRLSVGPGCPEFDDETASTIRSLSPVDVQDDSDDVDDFTDDASHRISLRGPKIRFHSRAPWETDDDASHAEGVDENPRSGMFGNRFKGKDSRTDHLIRTFTRASSIGGRPSVDSTRSKISATSSFDVTAGNYSCSRGALYDLARQSTSTSSLASSSTSVRSQRLVRAANHHKLSHFQPHESLCRTAVSLDGTAPKSAPILPSSCDASPSYEPSADPSLVPLSNERHSHDQFVHPYANPDLVPYTPSPEMIPSHHPNLGDIVESDSNSTVTDSASPGSAAFSVASTETSAISITSRDISHGTLRVNGKEISSPISVVHQNDNGYVDRSTRFLSLHPPPSGFEGPLRHNLNPRAPAVALITLQEAQARERFRSNTAHVTVARPSKLPSPSSDDMPGGTEDQAVETDNVGKMGHTRARSTSVGTRQRPIPLPLAQPRNAEVRDESPISTPVSAAPGRTLKHKKSGFMRLFGGRNLEGGERSPPPPFPHTDESSQILGIGKPSKPMSTKLPMAPLRSGASNTTLSSTYSASSGGDVLDGKGPSLRRRHPPMLSIVTKTSDHSIATSVSGTSSPMGLNFTPPPASLTVPQSAPPGNSDFMGLKLRPVSTTFSSHFADMVAPTTGEPKRDVHTPSSTASSNTALSPFTPVSVRRSDDASATAVEAPGEESLTIKGLQDQLVFAKKAWQQEILELRGQIKDLTSELEDLQAADNREYCEACGRGDPRKRHASPSDEHSPRKTGVVDRPRARTGDVARFASGN